MDFPFIISIPHGSWKIPQEIRSAIALNDEEIMESTDMGTREIFESLPAGVVLCARWSRLAADLNRTPNQQGPKGVVALVDYEGRTVYLPGREPDRVERNRRIREYYMPYHNKLKQALGNPGITALIDCHSLNGTGPAEAPDAGRKRKDIVLSNNGDSEGGPVTPVP